MRIVIEAKDNKPCLASDIPNMHLCQNQTTGSFAIRIMEYMVFPMCELITPIVECANQYVDKGPITVKLEEN